MILTHPFVIDALERLRHDIRATGRGEYLRFVEVEAANVATFEDEPADFVQKVVDDVQQRFQDEFIDTTWPTCPMHPNHPLDYSDGSWRCPHGSVAVAQLGALKG